MVQSKQGVDLDLAVGTQAGKTKGAPCSHETAAPSEIADAPGASVGRHQEFLARCQSSEQQPTGVVFGAGRTIHWTGGEDSHEEEGPDHTEEVKGQEGDPCDLVLRL
ncbi:unnamed protein product [Amoebophrya sp. A25]|nr:unnamed protein product [Amoebophrya sp. A25]|eukprot:GSA25T00004604001.1